MASDQRLIDALSVTVCITKGMFNGRVDMGSEYTSFKIEGQTSGRDDWILKGALELQKPIHVFFRDGKRKSFNYMGQVDHHASTIVRERIDNKNLLQAILVTDRGDSDAVNIGVSNQRYRFKGAVFDFLQADAGSVFPASFVGCFHIVREHVS
ncbi:unnamed protein product [Ectocarpus sp. 12 AP-2014]